MTNAIPNNLQWLYFILSIAATCLSIYVSYRAIQRFNEGDHLFDKLNNADAFTTLPSLPLFD